MKSAPDTKMKNNAQYWSFIMLKIKFIMIKAFVIKINIWIGFYVNITA